MKIITGKHKNRLIPVAEKSKYRPSTTKLREAIFSILSSGEFIESQPLIGARVLDLFSGTGSLAFEALSRGALFATLIDNNQEHLELAENFAKKIGEEKNTECLQMDASRLPLSAYKYNIVFIDPPYYNNLIPKTLESLIKNEWLGKGAIIAIELGKDETISLTNKLRLVKEKIYSNTKLLILKYE